MTSRNSHVMFALLGMALVWLVLMGFLQPAPTMVDMSKVIVDETTLDFGEIWLTNRFEWTVVVRNESDYPVEFSEFNSLCNCLEIEPESAVINPKGAVELRLLLDISAARPQALGGKDSFSTAVVCTTPNGSFVDFEVNGTVASPIVCEPHEINFGGGDPIVHQSSVIRPVRLRPTAIVADVRAKCVPELGRATVEKLDDLWLLSFEPNASRIGKVEGVIDLACELDKGITVQVNIPVRGSVVSDFLVVPESLHISAGGETGSIVVQSRSDREFDVRILNVPEGLVANVRDDGPLKAMVVSVSDVRLFGNGAITIGVSSGGAEELMVIPVDK